jgi:cytochrome b561
MPLYSTSMRYGTLAQALHWLSALVVAAAYVISRGGPEARVYQPALDASRTTHESLGMLVVGLFVLRLVWRLADRRPDSVPMPAIMRRLARLTQFVLIGLMIVVPATGLFGAFLEGHPVSLWFVGDIRPNMVPAHALGLAVSELHTTLGQGMIWLAGLHAGAAIFHHLYLRDGVLASMLTLVSPPASR